MEERDETRREILLEMLDEPITSLDALVEKCHRALSAQLWTTCCWPESGWKIGDYNFLVASVKPDADTCLYVQFWSEPGEEVLLEVGSGEWNPGAIRYIGPAERKALELRGYTLAGEARNYTKELDVDSPKDAEAAALEVLQVMFDVFGYRGQWQLEVERHRGQRADADFVHTSVTPEDFAKIAARAGWKGTVTYSEDSPVVAMRQGRRAFLASMDWPVEEQNLYALVTLQAEQTLKQPVSDATISRVNSTMRLVKVCRTSDRAVRVQMPLMLGGGVTEEWLAQSLQHWIESWRECERQLQRTAARTKRGRTSQRAALIH